MEKKTLQDRIFKYNVLLILIPVFIVATIATLSVIFMVSYIEKEAINENAPYVEEYFDSLDTSKPLDIKEMNEVLDEYGFSLQIIQNNGIVVFEEDKIPFIDSIIPTEDTTIVLKMGYTFVSRSITVGDDHFLLVASSYTGFENISPSNAFRIILWGFVVSSVLVLFVIIYLTRKLTKSIKQPIEILIDGSNKVKDGNLEVKLDYSSGDYDEFVKVCDAFNEMVSQLKENIDATEQIYQDRKVMIACISHDLKTPLTAIKGYSKGLIDGIANTPEKQQKYVQTIYDKACAMEELFNQLTLVSDLQTQAIHLNKLSINVKNSLDRIFEVLKNDYETKMELHYENECNDELWNIDEKQFTRVLVNLVENSYKYCNKEHIVIDLKCYAKENNIIVEFKDNGPGVDEDKLGKIFDLFYRADESRTTPQNGSGLGLAITKQIVELFNGEVEAQNDSGLKITIIIPKEA